MEAIAWAVRFADRPPQDTEDVLSDLERDGLGESIAALCAGQLSHADTPGANTLTTTVP